MPPRLLIDLDATSWPIYKVWLKLLFKVSARIEDPEKNSPPDKEVSSVSLNMMISTPLPGALLNWSVVALANVNAVVATPSSWALMSVVAKYGNVNE